MMQEQLSFLGKDEFSVCADVQILCFLRCALFW